MSLPSFPSIVSFPLSVGPAKIEKTDLFAELAMIDENLLRAELSPAERAQLTARRKAIYLAMNPETEHGGDRSKSQTLRLEKTDRFTATTAQKIGSSERLVQLNAERGAKVCQPALDLIKARHSTLASNSQVDSLVLVAEVAVTHRRLRSMHPWRAAPHEPMSYSRDGRATALTCTACGGLTRAVSVVPNTLDRVCEDTRPPERADECQAP